MGKFLQLMTRCLRDLLSPILAALSKCLYGSNDYIKLLYLYIFGLCVQIDIALWMISIHVN